MKKTLLTLITLSASVFSLAQSDIFAVTGEQTKGIDFKDFRFVDENGTTSKLILSKNQATPDQVVGMSYDTKNQNLLFIGMYSPDIYSYNLNSSSLERVYVSGRANSKCAIAEQFSRMGTLPNGTTYALNNNSTNLVEITAKNGGYTTKELGALKSDLDLNKISFWGGDLIADQTGNLYLISAKAYVVKINPNDLTATLVGKVSGLAKNFTTNGAAVTANGNVLLSNAQGKGFYSLNFDTLEAKKTSDIKRPIYDLASPYFIKNTNELVASNQFVSIYPTKVVERNITVDLIADLKGNGTVSIFDIAGNEVSTSKINLANNKKDISLNSLAPGNYYIKVLDANGKELINKKFVLIR